MKGDNVCGLFYGTVSVSDDSALNGAMTGGQLDRIQKKPAVGQSQY
jgi:hypothetical protein